MNSLSTGEIAAAEPDRRHARWRTTFAGLTPKVVAIVAALMLARTLGTALDIFAEPGKKYPGIGALLSENFQGFIYLMVMAAPMLLVIIATANLGPQRGPKRVAALAVAVIVSSRAGTLGRLLPMVNWDHWPNLDGAGALVTYLS